MNPKSSTLLAFHRRFLLHRRFGRSWRASLYELAKQKGTPIKSSSLSHIVAGDWRSSDLRVERFIADVVGVPFVDVWPEYQNRHGAPQRGDASAGVAEAQLSSEAEDKGYGSDEAA